MTERFCIIGIFVNESLTKLNREIFYYSRKFKNEGKLVSTYTFHGRVYIKKTDEGPRTLIKSLKDIAEFF